MSNWADRKAMELLAYGMDADDVADVAAALRQARKDALEEAARVAEEYGQFDQKLIASAEDAEERAAFQRGAFKAKNIAHAIRLLRDKT